MKFNLNLENINYIKIIYTDSDNVGHYAKAAIKRLGEKEIYACMKYEKELKVPAPQEVSISFACENALYTAKTTLKFVENQDPYVFFTLKTPDEIEYQQNREYFRVRIDGDAILSFPGTVMPCKIYDISANGVRLKLDKSIQIPEIVMIDILFSPKEVKTKAKFIRTDNEDGIIKASFTFIDIPEASRDIISQKCIQKQLSDKRKTFM